MEMLSGVVIWRLGFQIVIIIKAPNMMSSLIRLFLLLAVVLLLTVEAVPFLKYNIYDLSAPEEEARPIKRSDIRNCYFSPVQCLLPISEATQRMYFIQQ
uniref:Uncharacterized protein n=1 Tax=Panagrellus redivivus TaxID=6233 RepID=A0A7E4ZZI7_PANRE